MQAQTFDELSVTVESDGSVEMADRHNGFKHSVNLSSVEAAIQELTSIANWLKESQPNEPRAR